MSRFVAACVLTFLAVASAQSDINSAPEQPAKADDGAEALGPKSIKLQYHAPAQYPVHYPVAYPMYHPAFGYPYAHPAFAGAYAGAYPFAHPALAGAYPGAYPFAHPAVAAAAAAGAVHPAFNPYLGGFAEESVKISAKGKAKADPEADTEAAPAAESAAAPNPWAQQWANSAAQWKNYYSQPISQTQWPGANSRPGVHPTLGGTLNPYSPMGLPNHPYPFPMHQGLKNGKYHPRPFTPLGQYYPGTTSAPFLPGMVPGAGMYPTYFPAAHQGQMTAANAALQTSAKAKKN